MPEQTDYRRPEYIAKMIGVTVRRIQQLTQDGVLVSEQVRGQNGRRYDLVPTINRYIKYLQGRQRSTTGNINADEKLAAEARLKKAQATIAELQLKELEGKMYRAEDIKLLTDDLVYATRAIILSMPPRVSLDLADINSAAEVAAYMQRVAEGMLIELSEHEYSESKYMQLVHEREGVSTLHHKEDEEAKEEQEE